MKYLKQTIIFLLLGAHLSYTATIQAAENSAFDTAAEILVLRPIGFVATLVGVGFFLGTTPFTGVASIAPPHDMVSKAFEGFVVTPYEYTFKRPFSDSTNK